MAKRLKKKLTQKSKKKANFVIKQKVLFLNDTSGDELIEINEFLLQRSMDGWIVKKVDLVNYERSLFLVWMQKEIEVE